MRFVSFFFAFALLIVPCQRGFAELIVNWASTASAGGENVRFAPDGVTNSIGDLFATIQTNNFIAVKSYNNLESLLNIPFSTLASADVIAWEMNGGAAPLGGGWEATRFILNDTINSITIDHLEGSIAPGVIATGTVDGTAYNSFFGLATNSFTTPKVSWILLDNPGNLVDFQSPNFGISLISGHSLGFAGEGTADPDAIGVLGVTVVPECSSMALLGCIGGLSALRRYPKRMKPKA